MDGRCTRRLFLKSPHPGVSLGAHTYYTSREGLALTSVHGYSTRSDTTDVRYQRFSKDNGVTWSEPEEIPTHWQVPGVLCVAVCRRGLSTLRRAHCSSWAIEAYSPPITQWKV